jgi:hypothetical protein
MKPLGMQEAQGSPTLEALNDIVVPEPVSLVPQTVGWVVVGVAAIALIGVVVLLAWRRYRSNAYRRAALALVDTTPLDALPALVKRVALATAPRSEVAALTGEAWRTFLDRTYRGNGFTAGPGRALASVSFDPAALDEQSSADLRRLVARWIRRHRV